MTVEQPILAERQTVAESVPVDLIRRERDAGWPTMHPEDYCHRCGARNMPWHVDRDLWMTATSAWAAETGREGICCPQCFVEMYEAATGELTIWELRKVHPKPHQVHDHGPAEGRGLDCAEQVDDDGLLRGWCLRSTPDSRTE